MVCMKVPDHLYLARVCGVGARILRHHGVDFFGRPYRRRARLVLGIMGMVAVWWTPGISAAAETPGLQVGQEISRAARSLAMVDVIASPEPAAVTLEELRGSQGLLLVFSSNTCPYVLDWLDRLPRLAARGGAQGVPLVVVNANERKRRSTDAPEAMTSLWREHGFAFPYLVDVDAALADALGAQRTPEVFLFDGAWTLVYRGAIDDLSGPFEEVNNHYVDDALHQMLGQQPVLVSTADAIGCAIQRPRRRAGKSPKP